MRYENIVSFRFGLSCGLDSKLNYIYIEFNSINLIINYGLN